MLQQTTSTAVIPFYERFLARFPTVQELAKADLSQVLKLWAGLGYYSRARNLHKAARILAERSSFPKTHKELLDLPGFGPYTARAVSSLAFSEPVGVLDGNVIRVFSRLLNQPFEWWRPAVRAQLQNNVDKFVAGHETHVLNQALMELGSQICTPKNPKCLFCPLINTCEAKKEATWRELPLKKPRRAREIWLWQPRVETRRGRVRLSTNDYAPFLRGSWLLPGAAKRLKAAPRKFDFQHTITHHDIYVTIESAAKTSFRDTVRPATSRWVKVDNMAEVAPYSLLQKAWQTYLKKSSSMVGVLAIVMFAALLAGCQSTKKNGKTVAPRLEKVGPYALVTKLGDDNRAPKLSSDGTRLLYVSAKRFAHANPQLYELNLKTGDERRLTFQDGEIFDATYDRTGKRVIYSSSTDEIKENPQYLLDAINKLKNVIQPPQAGTLDKPFTNFWGETLPPTDLYIARIGGNDIRRLTHSYAFDGEVTANPKNDKIIFMTITAGHPVLSLMSYKSGKSRPFSPVPATLAAPANAGLGDEWPQWSPDGKKVVWVHELSPNKSAIWIADADGKTAKQLIGGDAMYWTPSWSQNGDEILYSSNATAKDVYDLYLMKSDGSCVRRITNNGAVHKPFRIWQAQLDSSETHVYFTSDVSGDPEIYTGSIQTPPCPQPPPALKSSSP